jgi:flavin-dependent thymidylate synthase
MFKVTLLNHTPNALETLLFTKQTRLSMNSGLMAEIINWPEEKKMAELNYMLGTIKSSWEFVDYTFDIEGVTRAFTHQFVRTRAGSYAQQSQRTVNMDGFEFVTPSSFRTEEDGENETAMEYIYCGTMDQINSGYQALIKIGANPQDARGLLPTNVCTNIIGKFSLRTLHDMAKTRLCTRTQGEYQDVFRAMRKEIILVHPWAEPFIRVACAADGVCQFPNFKECPIKPGIFNPDTGLRWDYGTADGFEENGEAKTPLTRSQIQAIWETTRFEAVPKETK